MGTSSQRSRRRRRPSARPADPEANRSPLLLNSREAAAAVALAGFVFLFVVIALLASGGGGNGGAAAGGGNPPTASGPATSGTGAATGTSAPTAGGQPTGGDEEAIRTLARKSIEVLPAGQWPSLYDSYTSEFQQRCPREEFNRAGADSATKLGSNLPLLRFKRLEGVTIEGSSAQVVIVGEFAGLNEYQTRAAFRKENGVWKIAPAAGTQGCQAFLSS